jgi:16S rRNA G966 N2-methylase RsmD
MREAAFLIYSPGRAASDRSAQSRRSFALFIDSDRMAIRTIHENLDHTGLAERATVLRASAFDYLAARSRVRSTMFTSRHHSIKCCGKKPCCCSTASRTTSTRMGL